MPCAVKPEILKLKESRGQLGAVDCKFCHDSFMRCLADGSDMRIAVNYAEYGLYPAGHVTLIGRVRYHASCQRSSVRLTMQFSRSHPDVGERYYPELFKQLFPNGMPAQGSAY